MTYNQGGRQPRCRQPRGRQPRERQHRGRGVGGEAAPIWLWNEVEKGNFTPTDITFQGVDAVDGILPENPTALDCFKLYFTDTLIDLIVTETNRYAEQFIEKERNDLKKYSTVHQWVPTDHDEINALLGILTLMGIIYKPRVAMYWSNDELLCTPIFKSLMTRDRFLLLVNSCTLQTVLTMILMTQTEIDYSR